MTKKRRNSNRRNETEMLLLEIGTHQQETTAGLRRSEVEEEAEAGANTNCRPAVLH